MFTLNDLYNITSANYYELEWQDQDRLEGAIDTYNKLSTKKQAQFDKLIVKATNRCKSDFSSLPEHYKTDQDIEILEQTIEEIKEKIEPIFKGYIK